METGMVFPVLPGKQEALLAFASALMVERRAEYEASQVGVTKESWFLQPTPHGDLCIIHFEAADPMSVFAGLAESQEPFDVWFREQVMDTTGIDLTQPVPGLPPRIFNWARG
jgi:hypothetical protein